MAEWIAYLLLIAVLATAAVTDWRSGRIYNRLTYPAMLAGLCLWCVAGLGGHETGIGQALLGLAAGVVPFTVVLWLGGIGGGDMKLMGAIGAISASWQVVLATSFYALALAAIAAIVVMVRDGLVKRTLARLFYAVVCRSAPPRVDNQAQGDQEDTMPRIAFGTAAAVGGVLAGAEQLLHLHTPWAWLGP